MPSDLILHAGMPKTATTYLQKQVFPFFRDIYFLEKPRDEILNGQAQRGIFAEMFSCSPAVWAEIGDDVFRKLSTHIRLNGKDRHAALISDEGMTSGLPLNPADERNWKDPYLLHSHFQGCRQTAIRTGFKAVKVILVFRRQDTKLASSYVQVSDRRRHASQVDFERFIDWFLDRRGGLLRSATLLNYALVREQLCTALGEENLLMLPYELLREHPQAFEGQIRQFVQQNENDLGSDDQPRQRHKSNVRSVHTNTWLIRSSSRNDRTNSAFLGGRFAALRKQVFKSFSATDDAPGQHLRLDEQLSKKILSHYTRTNRELGDSLHIDLSHYGYY